MLITTSKALTEIIHKCSDNEEVQQRLATVSLYLDGELSRILVDWMELTGFTERYAAFMDEGGDI